MSQGGEPGHLHPDRTRRSGFAYLFYDKHHGRGGPRDSRWAEDLTEDEEFGIFDQADEHELADGHGNLFGLRIGAGDEILFLGTLKQQVAKFPRSHPGQPWHGFPLGPLAEVPPPHPNARPIPRDALEAMVQAGLLRPDQKKRLQKGDHV